MQAVRNIVEPWVAALGFAVLLSLAGPWWSVQMMDVDEGFNLMKAVLVTEGHGLYSEIWSDQPPVMTFLLAGVGELFGHSVETARGVVLVFSVLLVWGLFGIVRREEGSVAAWVAVAVLVSGTLYQRLSVSVMIGLPAIALAVLALNLLLGAQGRLWRWILSGILMGLSLQTKMFTLVMLPAVGVTLAIFWHQASRATGAVLLLIAGWLIGLLAVSLGLILLSGEQFVAQLIEPHVAASLGDSFPYDMGERKLLPLLLQQPAYLVLGAAGLLVAWPWRRTGRWIPLIWGLGAAAALYRHVPLWPHQALLLLVPLSWLAGAGAGVLSRVWTDAESGPLRRTLAATAGLTAAAGLGWQVVAQGKQTLALFHRQPEARDMAAVERLIAHGEEVRWLVTDQPMDAYRAGLKVVPPLAVYSLKRVKSGQLSPEDVVAVMEEYRPELVSYRRLFMGKPAKAYLKAHYRQVPDLDRHLLYVRKDFPASPPEGGE